MVFFPSLATQVRKHSARVFSPWTETLASAPDTSCRYHMALKTSYVKSGKTAITRIRLSFSEEKKDLKYSGDITKQHCKLSSTLEYAGLMLKSPRELCSSPGRGHAQQRRCYRPIQEVLSKWFLTAWFIHRMSKVEKSPHRSHICPTL